MSLREKLSFRYNVAHSLYMGMQPCNSALNDATVDATLMQRLAENPHVKRLTNAIDAATSLQLSSCAGVKNTLLEVALISSSVAPATEKGNVLMENLLEAAMRCCDHWNDGPVARAEMVSDVRAIPINQCQALLEHFRFTYGKSE
jgi:hypothetical protein